MNGSIISLSRQLLRTTALVTLLAGTVAGCNTLTRLSQVGDEPKITPIQNPTARPDYKPVSMPMPSPKIAERNPNSLWRAGARAFFKDLRAKQVGDIMTVQMTLDDSAKLDNKTERDRVDNESANITNLLGFEGELTRYLPDGVNPAAIANFGNTHGTEGDGSIERSETISLTFAAVVTQVLPNGNLVIMGRQELRVNSELRELMVTGVVRPSDIDSDNKISHEKIAEMRVAYGGRGTLSELQQPRWGMQLWDILFPF
ncbi:MAG: flagellar basal body L-ring protein [Rhodospirillaceae bacterium]|nr:flagellar basal body L-ring protein [Magnetovibrio sp.]MAY67775.1 flagellar basal body L-ring protein [Rhodospirillaceae bacterium]